MQNKMPLLMIVLLLIVVMLAGISFLKMNSVPQQNTPKVTITISPTVVPTLTKETTVDMEKELNNLTPLDASADITDLNKDLQGL